MKKSTTTIFNSFQQNFEAKHDGLETSNYFYNTWAHCQEQVSHLGICLHARNVIIDLIIILAFVILFILSI